MKQQKIFSTAALISTVICSNAAAAMAPVSGALLKYICASYIDRPVNSKDGICVGYVVGVMSVMDYMNVLCLPDNSTHGQAALVVKKYLSDHPEKLHLNANKLVLDAIEEAFPCSASIKD